MASGTVNGLPVACVKLLDRSVQTTTSIPTAFAQVSIVVRVAGSRHTAGWLRLRKMRPTALGTGGYVIFSRTAKSANASSGFVRLLKQYWTLQRAPLFGSITRVSTPCRG